MPRTRYIRKELFNLFSKLHICFIPISIQLVYLMTCYFVISNGNESFLHFGYDFRSFIKIPEKGVYYFDIASDDGSRLFIDGKEIIDNDGSHSQEFVAGKVALEAGFHEMRIIYFEDYMGQSLKIKITDRYNSSRILPDDMLYTK